MVAIPALNSADRVRLGRRARASITYHVVEAIIAISAGVVGGSVALSASVWTRWWRSNGLIMVWQFRHTMPETREQQAWW